VEKNRQGEIAYLFLKYYLKQRGLPIDQNFRRRIGNIAKSIGVPADEVLEFATKLAQEILHEVSAAKEETSDHHDHHDFDDHHGH
jgi:hypothetical protein